MQALKDVELRLQPGEILAVVGENGAGKSTLMNILAGVLAPDAGQVLLDGREVRFTGVEDAQRQGIALIHQELNLADNLDVAGNVFLGREPVWAGPLRLIDRRRIAADTQQLIGRLGLDCSPQARVADLSVGQQQLVEIARALSLHSRILIMDEPTSSLSQRETDRLFQVIRDLKSQGIAVVYISHRLMEVQAIADRVVVLRDGRNTGELTGPDINRDAMVRLMVGRELQQLFQRGHVAREGKPLVQVRNLRWSHEQKQGITLAIHQGEIVGLAGLMGSGRTELAETLFGIRPQVSGLVELAGNPVFLHNPAAAIAQGIFLVPEDRRWQGLLLEDSVKHNISLPSLDRLSRLGLVARRQEQKLAADMCQQLNIRTPTIEQIVGLLSGGNQQKVVLAKWLSRTPRLLILDEPTRGVDVGAKSEIYAIMDNLASKGLAILMISSDLEEILGMSDRVLVMHDHQLAGELPHGSFSEEAVMHLATGSNCPPP